ncbi:MAG: ABC transporter ATP-binding protein [Proteobacteria bacterium]|jgi:tungstate transport system ATP-binding protein|nr:ABC transporter ATP-binding protein [Pseudomonadota bacterium]
MSPHLLEARGVRISKSGRRILDVDHLGIAPGETVAVLGPNGAGKSTLIQVLGLLERPEEGAVVFRGREVSPRDEREVRRRLACVFQTPLLLDRSVRENVELGLRVRGVGPDERDRRIERWCGRLGIAELAARRARTLSGGEAQRVNLARALVLEPEVLLLDEPLAALDAPTRTSMQGELGALIRGAAMAAVLVTHHRREALALGDRVAVMLGGRVRQIGTPDEVFSRPADLEIARFMGFENLLAAEGDGAAIRFPGGIALHREGGPDGPITVCLRAEDVRLLATGELPDPASNRLEGTLGALAPSGDGYLARIDFGGLALDAHLTRAEAAARGLGPGARCEASIRPAALRAIGGGMRA